MCGRFTLATAPEIVAEFFGLTSIPSIAPRYNVAPTEEIMRPAYERMPAIVTRADFDRWLDTGNAEPLAPLFRPFPAERMRACAVRALDGSWR